MKNPFRTNSAFYEEAERALELLKGQLPLFEAPLPTKLASKPSPELLEAALGDLHNAAFELRTKSHKAWLEDAQRDVNDAMEKIEQWLTSSS